MMKKKIEAFIRENGSLRELAVSGAGKPTVDQTLVERWQRVFNLIATEAREPITLILQITRDAISILVKSEHADQKKIEYYLYRGLYCESALGKNGLLVTSAASSAIQKNGHTISPAITAHFGLPLFWPDGELFGVICVLNEPKKPIKRRYRHILAELRITIEQELTLLHHQHFLLQTSETDALTAIYNRRKIEVILKREFETAKRYAKPFSVTIIDLNDFKHINDTFGHNVGDDILKAFAQSIGLKIRETDIWGRWGGDEFILVCPYANTAETQRLIARIQPSVNQEMQALAAFSDFSFGVSHYQQDDDTYKAIIKRADESMYQYKENYKANAKRSADRQNAGAR